MRSSLSRTRLGELLVARGIITAGELKQALVIQKKQKRPLGEILVHSGLVSGRQLGFVLARQFVLRSMAAILLTVVSLSGIAAKKAWAGSIADVPAKISVSFNQGANPYGGVSRYPALFGTAEKQSTNLGPFDKWSGMFARFDRDLKSSRSSDLVSEWRNTLKQYEGMELKSMAVKVNDFVNQKRYIVDSKNYGKSDYWATPVEFLERGGDCEDFAIAKYTALRMLGVPEERLRIMILHDNLKNIPHAVAVVYTDEGAFILDNQIKTLVSTTSGGRYRPIYTINRNAWWLHTAPSATMVASAQ